MRKPQVEAAEGIQFDTLSLTILRRQYRILRAAIAAHLLPVRSLRLSRAWKVRGGHHEHRVIPAPGDASPEPSTPGADGLEVARGWLQTASLSGKRPSATDGGAELSTQLSCGRGCERADRLPSVRRAKASVAGEELPDARSRCRSNCAGRGGTE